MLLDYLVEHKAITVPFISEFSNPPIGRWHIGSFYVSSGSSCTKNHLVPKRFECGFKYTIHMPKVDVCFLAHCSCTLGESGHFFPQVCYYVLLALSLELFSEGNSVIYVQSSNFFFFKLQKNL